MILKNLHKLTCKWPIAPKLADTNMHALHNTTRWQNVPRKVALTPKTCMTRAQ